ncbi:hypothetical protein Tco_0855543 [Tanacetum coccineum]
MSVDSMVAEDTHVFRTGSITNNYDHMSMDSMVEDCMQTPTPIPAFGQTSVASPQFKFDSATQPPMSSYALHPEEEKGVFGNLDAPASTALPGTPTNGISTTTTRTLAAIFSTSTPTPVIPSSVPTLVFGFGFATSTTPTISVAETGNTSVTNDKDLKSNSPFASTPFSTTTTTTGSGLFGSSSLAVTSTTKNQSLASFFNVSNGSQANTQASVAVTPSVPSLFGSGTTSIPSSTSGTSHFSSSAFTIGTSSSFSISSMTASSEGKYGNSTSGPTTSIFWSTWDPEKSSGFVTTYNDHMSMDIMEEDCMVAEDTHVFGLVPQRIITIT